MRTRRTLALVLMSATLAAVLSAMTILGWRKYGNPVIRVGLVATLSGPSSTWGCRARNGVVLAVEEANEFGGVNGRKVEVVTRDDKGDPETAVRVDRELVDQGVVALFGHSLSTVSARAIPALDATGIVVMDLGSLTSDLTGRDDGFVRFLVPVDKRAPLYAKLAKETLGLVRMAVVYDSSNPKYTVCLQGLFTKEFEKIGGAIVGVVGYDPRVEFSAPDIASQVAEVEADGVLLITNALNGALICQHLHMLGSKARVIASEWTFSDPDFLSNGGAALEGVMSILPFDAESSNESFVRYKKDYEGRFAEPASLADQSGYETAQALLWALAQTDEPAKLKETLLHRKVFDGLCGRIVLDAFGDASRTLYVSEIQGGRVVTTGRIDPAQGVEARVGQ